MKIAIFLADITNLGGVEQVSLLLANKLKLQGNEVEIVSYSRKGEISYFDTSNVVVEYLNIPAQKELQRYDYKDINNFFETRNYDFVSVQLSTAFRNLCPIANWKLYRLISKYSDIELVIHESPKYFLTRYNTNNDGRIKFFLKCLYTMLYYNPQIHSFFYHTKRYVRNFVTLSKGCCQELKKHFNLDSIIRYNPYVFFENEIRFEQKKNIVLFAGRLSPEKNLRLLLRAWNKIEKKQDYVLQIIGKGVEEEIIRSLIKNEHIEAVSLLPAISHSDLMKRFAESKIFVLPSFFEAFPTVISEAMNMRNAVICTKYDGFSDELIINGVSGFVVDFSESELTRKLQELIENPSKLSDMQEKAYLQCKKFYEENK